MTALLLAGCQVHSLQAATHAIMNEALAVCYDDATQSFSVTDRATGLAFLTNGRLEGKGTVKGRTIVVEQADGNTTLELRAGEAPGTERKRVKGTQCLSI